MKKLNILLISSLFLWISSCGENPNKYIKSPLDNIITTYIDTPNYSVILADMDYKEDTDRYFHKYKIIVEKKKNATESTEDDFDVKLTEWQEVSPISFADHQKDLGMTILSKKNGVLDKKATPAGYNNYVGNNKYGSWQKQSNGSSFWVFYGQYHFMNALLFGSNQRYYRNDYDYYRRHYYGKSNYYGRNNTFGTSTYKNANSSWSTKPQTFKEKVRNNVKRSTSTLKSKGYSSSKSYGSSNKTSRNSNQYSKSNSSRSYNRSSNKTSRNSNRYSKSSSSRSRSGGFGK